MERIVTCFPLSDKQVAEIRTAAVGYELVVSNQDTIADDLFGATIFCGHAKVPVPWSKIVAQGRLRWIQSTAAGLDHCLTPETVASPITISGCSGLFAQQVAEHTFALLLGLLRNMPAFAQAQREKRFERMPTDELQGKTVGILGFGGNGRRIAECLSPWRVRVLATDYFHQQTVPNHVQLFSYADQDKVISKSNILIVALPFLESTHLILGESSLGMLPQHSYLINVGRGQLLDESVVLRMLANGHLAGVGLDVTYTEPLPSSSELWNQHNTLITPHVGAQSKYRVPDTIRLFLENLGRWKNGVPLINLVDKSLGFPQLENRFSNGFELRLPS